MNFQCAIRLLAELHNSSLSITNLGLATNMTLPDSLLTIWLFAERYIILCWAIWLPLSSLRYLTIFELPVDDCSLSFWLFAELFDSFLSSTRFAELTDFSLSYIELTLCWGIVYILTLRRAILAFHWTVLIVCWATKFWASLTPRWALLTLRWAKLTYPGCVTCLGHVTGRKVRKHMTHPP